MSKIKMCCFTVNTTHALIISNNFITNNLKGLKVIYLNEKEENTKLRKIVNKFYKNIKDKEFFSGNLSEKNINKYPKENVVFIIHGSEKFVEETNKLLEINNFNDFVINCYDVYDVKEKISKIIERHDYYINTTGTVGKDFETDNYFLETNISKKSS